MKVDVGLGRFIGVSRVLDRRKGTENRLNKTGEGWEGMGRGRGALVFGTKCGVCGASVSNR